VYVQKRYEELIAEHRQWPDRVAALTEAFHHRMKQAPPSHAAVGHEDKSQQEQHQDVKSDL
jgi:hypothetical protein